MSAFAELLTELNALTTGKATTWTHIPKRDESERWYAEVKLDDGYCATSGRSGEEALRRLVEAVKRHVETAKDAT